MSVNEKRENYKTKVGVRYCGGCNPRYDRGAMVSKIESDVPTCEFESAREGEKYDMLLVVGGCSACCASYEQFEAEKVVKIWSEKMGFEQFGIE